MEERVGEPQCACGWRQHGGGCVLIGIIMLICSVIIFRQVAVRGKNPGQIERLINKANLSEGSAREKVEEWLNAQGWPHDVSTKEDDAGAPMGYQPSWAEIAGTEMKGAKMVVRARIRDAVVDPWWPWWNGEIWVYFFFDRNEELLKHVVKAWPYEL